jgi:hypothetical protein
MRRDFQIAFYVAPPLGEKILNEAEKRGMSASRYCAAIMGKTAGGGEN